jgi:hypothetical protein
VAEENHTYPRHDTGALILRRKTFHAVSFAYLSTLHPQPRVRHRLSSVPCVVLLVLLHPLTSNNKNNDNNNNSNSNNNTSNSNNR